MMTTNRLGMHPAAFALLVALLAGFAVTNMIRGLAEHEAAQDRAIACEER